MKRPPVIRTKEEVKEKVALLEVSYLGLVSSELSICICTGVTTSFEVFRSGSGCSQNMHKVCAIFYIKIAQIATFYKLKKSKTSSHVWGPRLHHIGKPGAGAEIACLARSLRYIYLYHFSRKLLSQLVGNFKRFLIIRCNIKASINDF